MDLRSQGSVFFWNLNCFCVRAPVEQENSQLQRKTYFSSEISVNLVVNIVNWEAVVTGQLCNVVVVPFPTYLAFSFEVDRSVDHGGKRTDRKSVV